MILRKPYAFLIKHFKLIHIILTILMFLFFLRMRDVTNFLTEYIDLSTYEQMGGVVNEYIGIAGLLLPIIIIAIDIVVLLLLKMKNKPIKFYLFSILAYFIELVMMIISFIVLTNIQQGEATVTFTQIFRDLIDTMSYATIPFIVVTLVRGVGFNIKQFNFKKDLMELNIVEEDSEEFELEVDVDTEDIKAKINRKIRFIKYTYLENKVIFFSIFGIIILGIVFMVFSYINNIEKIYKENETFNSYGLNLSVKNSYKTKYAGDGTLIRKDKFYVIVELYATNSYEQELNIPYENIYLRVSEDTKYSPIDNYKDEFAEFGLRFISTDNIKSLEKRQVVLLYEIDLEYFNNQLRFEYLISKESNSKDASYSYAKVDLKVKEFNKVESKDEKNIGQKLLFKNSFIEGTELTIEEILFNRKFSYKYTQLIGDEEIQFTKAIIPTDSSSYKKTIMRLTTDLKKNDKLNERVYSSLYEKYANIEYKKDGKIVKHRAKIIDLTPQNSKYTYLEVMEETSKSDYVALIFTIRDKEYKYILVNKEEK